MPGLALVTGAYGFMGRHVARRLYSHGWGVLGLGRGKWGEREQWGVGRWHEGAVSLSNLMGLGVMPNVIVHCAGTSTVGACFLAPFEAFERTMGSALAILEYMRLSCPDALLILASSAAVYGEAALQPISETASRGPVSLYGVLKTQVEEQCEAFSRYFGLDTVALRVFSAYGVESRKQLLWDACSKIASGNTEFSGTGDEVRDWINVSDIASLVSTIAESRSAFSGFLPINAATALGTPVRSVLEMLFDALGSDLRPQFDGNRPFGDPRSYIGDNARALELDWSPKVTLKHGLEEYARWYLSVATMTGPR